MKILLLTDGVPFPPDSGPRVKTYQLIRYLAPRHQVTLVSLGHGDDDEERAAALRPLCADLHVVGAARGAGQKIRAMAATVRDRTPYSLARHATPALHALLEQLVREAADAGTPFDLVHADRLVMATYAEALPLPRLLDAHNAVWALQRQRAQQRGWLELLPRRLDALLLRQYEAHICDSFEAIIAVSEEDRQDLLATGAHPRDLSVIPIGIDGEALAPITPAPSARMVLSLATPSWPPNAEGIAWFAREVFPLVRRAVPQSTLTICGSAPSAELRALATGSSAIEVTGLVDPQPYLAQAGVLIAPLRQRGGMRVMLPEALARGLPVVATSVACGDLDLVSGEHLLVADSASTFADAVALLLQDPELGQRIAAAGRRHVLDRYDWHAVYPALDTIYKRMVGAHPHQPLESPEVAPAAL